MEQIKNVMGNLKEIVQQKLPNAEFNIDITYKTDTNTDIDHWVIEGRFDTKKDWNDFFVSDSDLDKAIEKAKQAIQESINELQNAVA